MTTPSLRPVKTFYQVLANTLLATLTNNFLWFALIFWAYLETHSVLVTSLIGGSYMLISALFGLLFGTFVDHHKKKTAMLYSSIITLFGFGLATLVYIVTPSADLLTFTAVEFWIFVCFVLAGALAGNLRTIALSTTVTLLVPEDRRDKANGMVGTVNGVAFAITSVFSGIVIGWLGMGWALAIALFLTVLTLIHLSVVAIEETLASDNKQEKKPRIDVKGALFAIHAIPGLLVLIFFTTFNNLLNGVFIALIDPYGLSLVSVEAWGILLGVLTSGFILGGVIVAKKGLGKSPLRTLFIGNSIIWIASILFPLQPSVILLSIGMFVFNLLIPFIEASEQTIIQKVVPYTKQGRVFGFAQSVENAAAPLTAFLIGPLAQFIVIPFMSHGAGARTIGSWFGTGADRGMALIFIVASAVGLAITLVAMKTRSYKNLSIAYAKTK